MQTIVTIKTSPKKGADETETQLTIDWDVTQEKIVELATRSVVITQQSKYRRDGIIPKSDNVKVSTIGTRTASVLTPEKMIAAAASFTPEQKRALMEQLKGK